MLAPIHVLVLKRLNVHCRQTLEDNHRPLSQHRTLKLGESAASAGDEAKRDLESLHSQGLRFHFGGRELQWRSFATRAWNSCPPASLLMPISDSLDYFFSFWFDDWRTDHVFTFGCMGTAFRPIRDKEVLKASRYSKHLIPHGGCLGQSSLPSTLQIGFFHRLR